MVAPGGTGGSTGRRSKEDRGYDRRSRAPQGTGILSFNPLAEGREHTQRFPALVGQCPGLTGHYRDEYLPSLLKL